MASTAGLGLTSCWEPHRGELSTVSGNRMNGASAVLRQVSVAGDNTPKVSSVRLGVSCRACCTFLSRPIAGGVAPQSCMSVCPFTCLSVCLSVCPFTFLSVSHSLAANSSDVSLVQSIWNPQGFTCEPKSDCRPVSETQHVSLNIPCGGWYSEGFVEGIRVHP